MEQVKNVVSAIRMSLAKWKVRSLETTLHGQNECLACVRDQQTRKCIEAARELTRRDLAEARAEYMALLPVGQRMVWEAA